MHAISKIYATEEYLQNNPTWHAERAEWKAGKVRDIIKANELAPASVCDVGCGTAGVLRELANGLPNEVQIVGFEPSPVAFKLATEACRDTRVQLRPNSLTDMQAGFDLALCLDVFEHVDDYLGFLRTLSTKARWFIFHIPLDLSVQSVLRGGKLPKVRDRLGHLHYFTAATALATLDYAGYEIIDRKYTAASSEGPGRNGKQRAKGLVRRGVVRTVGPDLGVRLLGGYSMIVLAEAPTGSRPAST